MRSYLDDDVITDEQAHHPCQTEQLPRLKSGTKFTATAPGSLEMAGPPTSGAKWLFSTFDMPIGDRIAWPAIKEKATLQVV